MQPINNHTVTVVTSPTRPTSTMAVVSLVMSVVGFAFGCCSFGVLSLLAIIFGHLALRETSDERVGGHGMAVAGLLLGYIGIGPAMFLSVTWFLSVITARTHTP